MGENIVVTTILLCFVAGIFVACLLSLYKRFCGKQSCCGGTKEKLHKKKLKHIEGKYIVEIEGMRCDNCKRQVMKALNQIDGVSADVSLSKKTAVVSYEHEVSQNKIVSTIELAGFFVTAITIK